jgi:hypothetical protein
MSSANDHQPSEQRARRATPWLAIATAAIVLLMMLAFASVALPKNNGVPASTKKPAAAFDPTAMLVSAGHQLRASGPAPVCRTSEMVFLRVTVRQAGVIARGRWSKHHCIGAPQRWRVLLTTLGDKTLKRGAAIGHGKARITKDGKTVVRLRWSRKVKLI